jgi:hypothetical protein
MTVTVSILAETSSSERSHLVLIVAAYAVICFVTNQILVARPSRHQLIERIEEEYSLLAIRRHPDEAYNREVTTLLEGATTFVSVRVPWYKKRGRNPDDPRHYGKKINHPLLTLSKVLAGWRLLHAAERVRICATDDSSGLCANALIAIDRLNRIGRPDCLALATHLDDARKRLRDPSGNDAAHPDTGDVRVLLMEGLRVAYDHDESELETAAEAQRRTVWLTFVGLFVVTVLGLIGRSNFLLFGALGGFLAPLTRVWQRKAGTEEYGTSWGILMLSPVAGAIAAYAGLLIVRFLADSDINLMGDVFEDNSWDSPDSPVALGLAVLFGFSGTLLSRLALAAGSQVVPPSPGSESAAGSPPPGRSRAGTDEPDLGHTRSRP